MLPEETGRIRNLEPIAEQYQRGTLRRVTEREWLRLESHKNGFDLRVKQVKDGIDEGKSTDRRKVVTKA